MTTAIMLFEMAILINKQSQMQAIRRALSHCYICGESLPPKGPHRRQLIVGEHVVPRALLGPPPANAADRWSVELDVHKECEECHKHSRDEFAKMLHLANVEGVDRLSDQQFQSLTHRIEPAPDQVVPGSPHGIMKGGGDAIVAAQLWLRGLHTALYGTAPPSVLDVAVIPPVPVVFESDIERGLASYETRRTHVMNRLAIADQIGRLDRLIAWGGQVRFACCWSDWVRKFDQPWCALWAIELPGVLDWSASVCRVPSPWCGYHTLNEPPPGASVLLERDCRAFSDRVRGG